MTKILALIVLLSVAACQSPLQGPGICKGPRGVRPCSASEQAMIDGMRGIISQIRNFDTKEFASSFAAGGAELDQARLLIFGERHTEIISQIETLGAMNALTREGDYLLLEGSDRREKYAKNCALYLIFQLYINWQWESKGQNYTVRTLNNKDSWMARKNFVAMLKSTKASYDISDLNLTKLTCGFWDDRSAIADTLAHDVTPENFEKRNLSMVKAIDEALKHAERVFIITGYLHMPNGDFLRSRVLNQSNPKFPKDINEYYKLLRKGGKARTKFVLENTAGTTEPIYNYLINNNIAYRELLHGKLLYQ